MELDPSFWLEESERENEKLRAEIERLRAGNKHLGFWMAAALEDSNVCDMMKNDIRAWFESQEQ